MNLRVIVDPLVVVSTARRSRSLVPATYRSVIEGTSYTRTVRGAWTKRNRRSRSARAYLRALPGGASAVLHQAMMPSCM